MLFFPDLQTRATLTLQRFALTPSPEPISVSVREVHVITNGARTGSAWFCHFLSAFVSPFIPCGCHPEPSSVTRDILCSQFFSARALSMLHLCFHMNAHIIFCNTFLLEKNEQIFFYVKHTPFQHCLLFILPVLSSTCTMSSKRTIVNHTIRSPKAALFLTCQRNQKGVSFPVPCLRHVQSHLQRNISN